MTSHLTSMDAISLSRTVFEIFDFEVFRVWPWPLTPKVIWGRKNLHHSKGHIWLPIWLLWTPSLYLIPFWRYSTSTFLEFDLDLWPLEVIWVIWGQSNFITFEKPYMTSYLTYMDTISLSGKCSRASGGTGLIEPTFQQKFWYSTSKFLGFDLDLWPLEVIWGQKFLYYSKGHIWLPIWLLWTPSLYLVPFSRYSTSKFSGFDLDLWPLRSSGYQIERWCPYKSNRKSYMVKKNYAIRKAIYDFLFDFYGHHLSIS